MLQPFTTLSREVLADCRIFKLERVRRRSGLTGEAHDFVHLDCPDWINVVALTDAGELVCVRQERHGTETVTLELPGGMVDEGESPEQAALRELREETGFVGTSAIHLGFVHPNPALQDNRCHTFLVQGCVRAGEQQLDGREEIDVVLVPKERVRSLVRSGAITHALVVAGLYLHELREPLPDP